MEFYIPKWTEMLPPDHPMKAEIIQGARTILGGMRKVKDIYAQDFTPEHYVSRMKLEEVDLASGCAKIRMEVAEKYYYENMSELAGVPIAGEYELIALVKEMSQRKEAYEKVADAMAAVQVKGYGVVGPGLSDIKMEDPVLVLKDTKSVYLNSTSGERILYNAVSSISISSYPVKEKMMQQYNNVEVALEGSLWAEDDTIYMDVENIYGEAREEETEKETQKETEKATEKKTDKKESTSEDLTKNDYIIPDSDKKYLTDADVENLTLREINYAKNELYARHGRKFDSNELRTYFESKSWYRGTVDPEDFSVSCFNQYENANAAFLNQKENERGVYQLDK